MVCISIGIGGLRPHVHERRPQPGMCGVVGAQLAYLCVQCVRCEIGIEFAADADRCVERVEQSPGHVLADRPERAQHMSNAYATKDPTRSD